jgi:hypothetical protein
MAVRTFVDSTRRPYWPTMTAAKCLEQQLGDKHWNIGTASNVLHIHPAKAVALNLEPGPTFPNPVNGQVAFEASQPGSQASMIAVAIGNGRRMKSTSYSRRTIPTSTPVRGLRPGSECDCHNLRSAGRCLLVSGPANDHRSRIRRVRSRGY